MPSLGGFEVVGELEVATLNQILKGAWDNNILPHSVNLAPGTAFGPYQLADGVIDIARDTLHLEMDVPVNGVRITLPAVCQVEIANPPVQSARFFDLTTDVVARVPIGVLPGTICVAALLAGIPRSSVSATLTGADPVPSLTLATIAEYVHTRYADGTIPHTISQTNVSLGAFSADAWIDLYDDAAHPTHQINVTQPTPTEVEVRIPFHLKLTNLSVGLAPCGVVGKLVLKSDFLIAVGSVTSHLSTATCTLADYAPAPVSDALGSYDNEGGNYSVDNAGSGGLLESGVKARLTSEATALAQALGNIVVAVPTRQQIEEFIADQAHAAIVGRGNIALWTPAPPPGGGVTVTDVKPLALPSAICFCLNNPTGNTGAIVNFIPPTRSCAIGIDGAKVIALIHEQIDKPKSEGGFGGLPHTFDDVDGHKARLTRLNASLRDGSIHLEGDVTVVDAIAGSIDVDASFEAEVGLEWTDQPDGTQMLHPFVISKDVDLSLLAWILSFLVGFITFGLVGGIIAIVIVAVVEGIAEKIGGVIIRDQVTGQVKSIGAWPQQLEGIGDVTARFENPVLIDAHSVTFPDAYVVTATFASVTDALARANGPYIVPEGTEVTFQGGPVKPHTTYAWEFGDGTGANTRVARHRYADDGRYIAKLTTTVNEDGGVVTRHFAAVRVVNVAATVNAGLPLTIDEGQVVEYVATFTDPGWPDTHTAVFDFGDDQLPTVGTVQEEHNAPLGTGSARAKHAYCDNGIYIVTVRVMDDDGGVGVATKTVTALNVPPTVVAGVDMFAYPCTPITLVARFTDPGWCDEHTATWDFGDCSPVIPATVRERHDPPAGCGIAAATHRYNCCGDFLATATVTDDDGGVGRDSTVVRVVDVANGDFAGGFRSLAAGVVANAWEPYVIGKRATARYDAEEFVVHGGQRSQRVTCGGPGTRAGLLQHVGTNVDWDYQITAWFHAREGSAARYRLGIDPAGEDDPDGTSVVWSDGLDDQRWSVRTVRATALVRRLTIFLEASMDEGARSEGAVWFDDVTLLPYPCPLGDPQPCQPPSDRESCIDWKSEQRPRVLGPTFSDRGFTFTSAESDPLRVVVWGPPVNSGKLQLPRKRLVVDLPFAASRVTAHVVAGASTPIAMRDRATAGGSVAPVLSSGGQGIIELQLSGLGITQLEFTGGGGEGLLLDLCAYDGRKGTEATPNTSKE